MSDTGTEGDDGSDSGDFDCDVFVVVFYGLGSSLATR